MRTKCFGHEKLKCPFSQVEGDFNLQEMLTLIPLPLKIATREKNDYSYNERVR